MKKVKNTDHVDTWGEWKVDGDYYYRECTVCGEKSEKEHHHGGSSSCEHKAVCEVCGAEYGALDEHQYDEWKSEAGNHEQHYVTFVLPYDIAFMKVTRFDPNISRSWDSEWNATGDITIVPGTYSYSATM